MISIAMTTYNGEKYLREQLDSILAQNYKDFEVIVCDDKSSDGTKAILAEYESKDSRIKVYLNETNLGFKKNFEKAVSLCKGDFIAFADQDDIWEPFKLERAINNIGEKDVYCSDALIVDSNNNPGAEKKTLIKDVMGLSFVPDDQVYIQRHLLFRNFCQGATMLSRADFLRKYSKIPDECLFHDFWFAVLASVNNGIFYDDICTLRYRQHGNNVTSNVPKNFLKHFLYINKNRDQQLSDNSTWCAFIASNDLFPSHYRDYAALMHDYYESVRQGKIFKTLRIYSNNYKYWFFDNSIIHRCLLTLKFFAKVVVIKFSKK